MLCVMMSHEQWFSKHDEIHIKAHDVPRLEQEDFKTSTNIWSQEAYGHNQNIYNKHTLHWQTRAECMCRQTNIVLLLLWLKIGNHIILGRRMVEMCKASMDSLWQKRLQNCSFQWVHWECLFVHKCDHHLGLSKGQIRTLEQSISFVMNLHSYFSIPDT